MNTYLIKNNKQYETGYIKYLTKKEFILILNEVNKRNSKPFKLCIKLMGYLAVRIGDATKLKTTDFNKDYTELRYKQEKTKKYRSIQIPLFFQKELKEYIKEYEAYFINDYLFPALYNTPHIRVRSPYLKTSTIRHFFKVFRRKYGYDKPYYVTKDNKPLYRISPHTLKHLSGRLVYLASGRDLIFTKHFLGHTEMKHTIRYLEAIDNKLKQAEIISKAFINLC